MLRWFLLLSVRFSGGDGRSHQGVCVIASLMAAFGEVKRRFKEVKTVNGEVRRRFASLILPFEEVRSGLGEALALVD